VSNVRSHEWHQSIAPERMVRGTRGYAEHAPELIERYESRSVAYEQAGVTWSRVAFVRGLSA
jgi:hypothetical protein